MIAVLSCTLTLRFLVHLSVSIMSIHMMIIRTGMERSKFNSTLPGNQPCQNWHFSRCQRCLSVGWQTLWHILSNPFVKIFQSWRSVCSQVPCLLFSLSPTCLHDSFSSRDNWKLLRYQRSHDDSRSTWLFFVALEHELFYLDRKVYRSSPVIQAYAVDSLC